MTAPRYQEFGPERIPTAIPAEGVRVKVIAGRVAGIAGPILQPATDPTYLDLALRPGAQFVQSLPPDYAAFVYVFEGSLRIGADPGAKAVRVHELAVLGEGEAIRLTGVSAGEDGETARAILEAGRPLRSEEHTSELQSQSNLVCRLLLEKKTSPCYIRTCAP